IRRRRGQEPWLRRKMSLLYYRLLQKTTRIPVLQNTGDFRLLDRICIDALTAMRENQRYTKGLYCQIGFRKASFEFDQMDREAGYTKWNFRSLLSLAIDGITSYTTAPLRLATVMGMAVSLAAFIYMVWVFVKAALFGDPQAGFPTIMTVMLFLGGVQLLTLGILGEYVGRIFNEVKRRPPYFIREIDGKKQKYQNPEQP
ncbi:MAG: glycosyltransferase, partial [Muribaculaceae bacterium]|nr:glycosyltransferase [Muribaculaceae bacterium]